MVGLISSSNSCIGAPQAHHAFLNRSMPFVGISHPAEFWASGQFLMGLNTGKISMLRNANCQTLASWALVACDLKAVKGLTLNPTGTCRGQNMRGLFLLSLQPHRLTGCALSHHTGHCLVSLVHSVADPARKTHTAPTGRIASSPLDTGTATMSACSLKIPRHAALSTKMLLEPSFLLASLHVLVQSQLDKVDGSTC